MINYTERIALLMQDIVRRTPALSFIDLSEVLVFARFGRSEAEGAFATCHCLTLPESEPGYFFWRDRDTGELTRRSEWFVTKSPVVRLGDTSIKYLISFVLPRFCDQTLERSRKAELYPDAPGWIAKLDTIVHELYHIDPDETGHPPVRARRRQRLDALARPALLRARRRDGEGVSGVESRSGAVRVPAGRFRRRSSARYGGVVATTFRNFPSFPQRYMERLEMPAADCSVRVEPLKPLTQPVLYTEDDLHVRQFTGSQHEPPVAQGPGPGGVELTRSTLSDAVCAPTYARRPVRRAHPLDAHFTARARRVHELISADRHPDVRRARSLRC